MFNIVLNPSNSHYLIPQSIISFRNRILRFEKPEKYGIWAGTLDATKFGPSCYQTLGMEKDLLQNQNTIPLIPPNGVCKVIYPDPLERVSVHWWIC
jgi:hypothetical protein